MESVKCFEYNNNPYILLEGIKEAGLNDKYFLGCKSMRKCVDKREIPESVCLFMKNDKVYTKHYKAADVYVEKQYAITNIFDKSVFEKKKQDVVENRKKAVKEKRVARKHYDDSDIADAPPLVQLEDHEMFKDAEGNPMEIEVRGEKQWDKVYFKAYDVGKAFNYERINDVTLDIKSNNVYQQHFIYFNVDGKKVLYLTTLGLYKFIFCARDDRTTRYQQWVSKALFTIGNGSDADRFELAADILNVHTSTISEMFGKSTRNIPCVYLYQIGSVGELRGTFKLDKFTNDNANVYKFGMTNNIVRRTKEHARYYGKCENNNFKLTMFSIMDEKHIRMAETELKNYFVTMNMRVNDPKHNELIVAEYCQIQTIKALYNDVYTRCTRGVSRDSPGGGVIRTEDRDLEIAALRQQVDVLKMQLNHKNEQAILQQTHYNELSRLVSKS